MVAQLPLARPRGALDGEVQRPRGHHALRALRRLRRRSADASPLGWRCRGAAGRRAGAAAREPRTIAALRRLRARRLAASASR
ncbi:MAG: hypothetical protein MZW92_08550 [Comamonadaceae bacterium]|nr:hypothetical protein [Comamonadaceae bacterium]